MLTGRHQPMSHQIEDVERLRHHPRVNIWNGLGTGKMNTGAWLALRWYLDGLIDEVVVVAPSMTARDWVETFERNAWPEGLAVVHDARPPNQNALDNADRVPVPCRVVVTTYGGLRRAMDGRRNLGSSRYVIDESSDFMQRLRGRRVCVIFDEAQAAATESQQGEACAAFAASCSRVVSMTATPVGNPLSLRMWGMTRLVRPDLLQAVGEFDYYGTTMPNVATFTAFKAKYAALRDPRGNAIPVPARSFPVRVYEDRLKQDIIAPMSPFTVQRRKEDCLDLPEKVFFRRSYPLPPQAARMMQTLIDEDRAILNDERVVATDNALENRLRTLELCGGFLAGEPIHDGKLKLLKEVITEIVENVGSGAPILIWASRTRELIACAAYCAGLYDDDVMSIAARAAEDPMIYAEVVNCAEEHGVGLIHGPTSVRRREIIQNKWRDGKLRVVCAHPGVAGAGLNWQHVRATIYYSPPLGVIARSQSEDRVHRKGLTHLALYYDLVTEDGPDDAAYAAHREQASVGDALIRWMANARR